MDFSDAFLSQQPGRPRELDPFTLTLPIPPPPNRRSRTDIGKRFELSDGLLHCRHFQFFIILRAFSIYLRPLSSASFLISRGGFAHRDLQFRSISHLFSKQLSISSKITFNFFSSTSSQLHFLPSFYCCSGGGARRPRRFNNSPSDKEFPSTAAMPRSCPGDGLHRTGH